MSNTIQTDKRKRKGHVYIKKVDDCERINYFSNSTKKRRTKDFATRLVGGWLVFDLTLKFSHLNIFYSI